jgi:5-methylcytosine-specific restriction endonuclease McrBC regulatory subunit McrC
MLGGCISLGIGKVAGKNDIIIRTVEESEEIMIIDTKGKIFVYGEETKDSKRIGDAMKSYARWYKRYNKMKALAIKKKKEKK